MKGALVIILLVVANTGLTQKGFHVYGGVTSGVNAEKLMTPDNKAHNGLVLGFETRLRPKDKFSVIGGAQYVDVNFIADDKSNLVERNQTMKWAKVRLGAMYKVLELNKSTCLRAKAYGTGNILMIWPEDNPSAPYDRFNPVTGGWILGLGVDVFDITLDFDYEVGFINSIRNVDDSTWNFWSVAIGVHF